MYLNSKNVIYPPVADIVWRNLEKNKENFDKLKKNLSKTRTCFNLSIPEFILRSIALLKNNT